MAQLGEGRTMARYANYACPSHISRDGASKSFKSSRLASLLGGQKLGQHVHPSNHQIIIAFKLPWYGVSHGVRGVVFTVAAVLRGRLGQEYQAVR